MKNVRLFAVAAALGMFASTVAAAETTTPKTTVKWSSEGTIIKVDLGEEVILPSLTAKVETVKTSEECQNGTDANGDGKVDGNVYAVDADVNAEQHWLYTNAKYWATGTVEKHTAIYYMGLGNGGVTGGRFLAPGSEEIEDGVFADQLGYKHYTVETAYAKLESDGYIKTVKTEDGDIDYVEIEYTENTYSETSKNVKNVSYYKVVSEQKRYCDEYIMEAIVDLYANGTSLKTVADKFKVYSVTIPTATSSSRPNITLKFGKEAATTLVANNDSATYLELLTKGLIVTVDADRHGFTSDYKVVSAESAKTYTATGSDLKFEDLDTKSVYSANGTSTTFKLADAKFVATTGDLAAWTTEYKKADSGEIAKVAYAVAQDDGTSELVVTDWKSTDMYIVSGGEMKKVDGDKVKLTVADLDKLYIGTKKLSALATGTYKEVAYAGLAKPSKAYDFVTYNNDGSVKAGYNTAEAKSAKAYVVGNSEYTTVRATKATDNTKYNQLTKLARPGYVTIVDISEADIDGSLAGKVQNYAGSSVVTRVAIEGFNSYELITDYQITFDDFAVEAVRVARETATEATMTKAAHATGLYELTNVPANTSDYYVIADGVGGLDLSKVWSYSSKKETGTLIAADGSEIECKAVELGGKGAKAWYPAFETEEELIEAVYAVSGFGALEGKKDDKTASSFKTWYTAATADLDAQKAANDKRYDSLKEELPTSATEVKHGAADCVYELPAETVDATVTVDSSAINKDVAGVYDAKYTAKVGEDVVGETTVKVVVAPNYTRTWENGRVKTLVSYYVNDPTAKYAEYNYDWAKKSATVTYYNLDGSVATTATIAL